MTIKEAERVSRILEDIKIMENGSSKIHKLHKDGEYEKVANIACELYSELKRHYENELSKYPSPNGG